MLKKGSWDYSRATDLDKTNIFWGNYYMPRALSEIYSQRNSCFKVLNTEAVLCRCQVCTFIKNRLQHRCFPVNIVKFLRATFFIEHLWWLLTKSSVSKKPVLKNFENFTGRHRVGLYFSIKLKEVGIQIYEKETPIQVCFCQFYEKFSELLFYITQVNDCSE